MDVFEALYTTRAMRRVKEDPIPDDVVKSILDSAIRAPSGSNRQDWKFVVVTDKDVREKLSDIYKETWDYYVKSFYNNSEDLGASNLKDKDQIEEDCSEMSDLERNAEESSRQVTQQMICHYLKNLTFKYDLPIIRAAVMIIIFLIMYCPSSVGKNGFEF